MNERIKRSIKGQLNKLYPGGYYFRQEPNKEFFILMVIYNKFVSYFMVDCNGKLKKL